MYTTRRRPQLLPDYHSHAANIDRFRYIPVIFVRLVCISILYYYSVVYIFMRLYFALHPIRNSYQNCSVHIQAYFKLQNCLSSTNPSIDTFLHLYGSEIWGMFSVDSSSCREKNDYCFEIFFSTSHTEQSHVKNLKYI